MTFGRQAGPPASDKQLKYLLALVQQAGYTDFREARHPLSLNQRQAKGRFTRGEASELIDRLVGEQSTGSGVAAAASEPARSPEAGRPAAAPGRTLRQLPLERLVAELERRGFKVVPTDADSTGPPAQDGSMP